MDFKPVAMIAALFLLLVSCCPKLQVDNELSVAGRTGLIFCPNQKYFRTAVKVEKDSIYELRLGKLHNWRDGRVEEVAKDKPLDISGFETWVLYPFVFLKRVMNAKWYELMAEIVPTNSGEKNAVFSLAREEPPVHKSDLENGEIVFTAPIDGVLYLYVNDACFKYGNNHGSVEISINKQP